MFEDNCPIRRPVLILEVNCGFPIVRRIAKRELVVHYELIEL